MTRIHYEGASYDCREGETVLEALLRQGKEVPFSCRSGSCHVCLRRAERGSLPEAAQRGLKPTLRERGYFLPCKCKPTEDLVMAAPRDEDMYVPAMVVRKELLAPGVLRLLLEPASNVHYRAGQYVNVRGPGDIVRSYSLASLADEDPYLELHVGRVAGGRMSTYLFDEIREGDELAMQGPHGNVAYVPGSPDQPLLLIGTGTGAAPLLGVLRDALRHEHRGPVALYHGSRAAEHLYLDGTFRALAARHAGLRYVACVSGDGPTNGATRGRAHDVALRELGDLRAFRVFLAGVPGMVRAAQDGARRRGARVEEIHADPFWTRADAAAPAPSRPPMAPSTPSAPSARPSAAVSDAWMWEALGRGELLSVVLDDFYTRVFADERLSPYFRNVTKDRLVEKVYSFMRQLFTGEAIYFGNRPKNAHHWMVIGDELFDYRNDLMERVLREHGLPERVVERWRAIEESYRADIVKDRPWPLVVDGVELPLEGFGEIELTVGSLCDGCQQEVSPGATVRYHLRLGTMYCGACMRPAA